MVSTLWLRNHLAPDCLFDRWGRIVEGKGIEFRLETVKAPSGHQQQGKYGRYLAIIYKDNISFSLNDLMVTEGHAELKDYG